MNLPRVSVPKIPKPPSAARATVPHAARASSATFKPPKPPTALPHQKVVKPPKTAALGIPKTGKVHLPWLGNKTMTPRMPGSGKAHKEQQVTATGYPSIKF